MLSDRDIRWVLQIGELEITPSPLDETGPTIQGCCVDLRLHDVLQEPKESADDFTVELETFQPGRFVSRNLKEVSMTDGGYVLSPGEFILGKTAETVKLGNRLSGKIEGRSRFARLGIGVHITAPKIDPGFRNAITLEIFNLGPWKVELAAGIPICTLLIEELRSSAEVGYSGVFQGALP